MRLPADATLLLSPDAPPELEQAWREERLPMAEAATADLDGLPTATIVACDVTRARDAAALGFRTFLVGPPPAPEGVRCVTLAQALEAARAARARERWKAARTADG